MCPPPTGVTQGERMFALDLILDNCVSRFGRETKPGIGRQRTQRPLEFSGRCLIILLRLQKKKLITPKIKAFRGLRPQISNYFLTVRVLGEREDLDMRL